MSAFFVGILIFYNFFMDSREPLKSGDSVIIVGKLGGGEENG